MSPREDETGDILAHVERQAQSLLHNIAERMDVIASDSARVAVAVVMTLEEFDSLCVFGAKDEDIEADDIPEDDDPSEDDDADSCPAGDDLGGRSVVVAWDCHPGDPEDAEPDYYSRGGYRQ